MSNIFDPFFTQLDAENTARQIALTDNHIEAIFTTYQMLNEDNTQKAIILFLLSGIFAKFSSSSFFGTEEDSPAGLRYYAYRLLKRAHQLSDKVVCITTFTDLENRFFGIEGAFTCTQVISTIIITQCKNLRQFDEFAESLIPPAWQ